MTSDELKRLISERDARYVTVAFVDLQGQLRGKTIAASKLYGALTDGIPFAPHNLMLDFTDELLWPEGYLEPDLDIGDNRCNVAFDQPRTLPFEDRNSALMFFAQFAPGTQGGLWDPRVMYERAADYAAGLDLFPVMAFEYEFRVFQETPKTARSKGYQNLELLSDVSTYGGVMHQGVWSSFFKDLREMCDNMEVPPASLHWEVAASMGEVALDHQPGVRALDNAALFKTHAKTLAQRHDMLLSFMARPISDADGQSGHVHVSVNGADGHNRFFDPAAEHNASETQRHFLGGLQTLLPEWLLMLAPNINSFKRLVPGIFAPISANWGIDNRTCAIRLIPGGAGSQRLEVRVPGADTNPYLVAAAILGAGAWGVENQIEPAAPVTGSSYRRGRETPEAQRFPPSFLHAITRFRETTFGRTLFGDDFVDMFAATRAAQEKQFSRLVTDRELERFLEMA